MTCKCEITNGMRYTCDECRKVLREISENLASKEAARYEGLSPEDSERQKWLDKHFPLAASQAAYRQVIAEVINWQEPATRTPIGLYLAMIKEECD